ncbi:MAG TPA: permease [Cyanobacteria bacterium UBA8156]|nr:permease [Cyanobacteria bacterium UBA8156]
MLFWFGHALAVAIGVSLGLLGGGGSILAVPILVYVMGVPGKAAIALSLMVVGVASVVGAVPHYLQGNVNLRTALLFSPTAMAGSYLGARLAALPVVTPQFQLLGFTAMMFVAAFLMIRKPETPDRPGGAHPYWQIGLEGLGVGALTGFVGIGGGFMVIPALVLLGNTPMKEAVGTSLVIIALKSATGVLGYLGTVPIDGGLALTFTGAAVLGMGFGVGLSWVVPAKSLEKSFGYFVLAVATFLLIQNLRGAA